MNYLQIFILFGLLVLIVLSSIIFHKVNKQKCGHDGIMSKGYVPEGCAYNQPNPYGDVTTNKQCLAQCQQNDSDCCNSLCTKNKNGKYISCDSWSVGLTNACS